MVHRRRISDWHSGSSPDHRSTEEYRWRLEGLILYDPDYAHNSSATEYLNVDIQAEKEHVSLTMDWYLISWLGDGEFFDEFDMEDSVFIGEWVDDGFWASGAGTVRLTAFYTQGDVQYAIGTMDTPDGIPAYIALVRP